MIIAPIKGVFDPKGPLRARMTAERRAIAASGDAKTLARHAAGAFIRDIPMPDSAIVALYHPIRDELDTEPLFDALTEKGFDIALPVTPKRKAPLMFRRFRTGDALVEGRYGVMTPAEDAAEVTPHIVVAPLLGFTRAGDRLGYGGGYYDRTLAARRAGGNVLAVGYGFARQELERLPVAPNDEPMDWIVTERGAIRANGS